MRTPRSSASETFPRWVPDGTSLVPDVPGRAPDNETPYPRMDVDRAPITARLVAPGIAGGAEYRRD